VHRVPSVPLPGYRTFRLGLSAVTCPRWLAEHRANLVHLASPFVLGARNSLDPQRWRAAGWQYRALGRV
jgi:phosphatidylinositol alpha 1,6-mannosyltransferase